jgi:hypothetical protein
MSIFSLYNKIIIESKNRVNDFLAADRGFAGGPSVRMIEKDDPFDDLVLGQESDNLHGRSVKEQLPSGRRRMKTDGKSPPNKKRRSALPGPPPFCSKKT